MEQYKVQKIDSQIYVHLIFYKGTKGIKWWKKNVNRLCDKQLKIQMEKSIPHITQKNQLEIDHRLKVKT